MSFSALNQRAWSNHNLLLVLIELTYRCNLDCFFCYNDVKLKGRPLGRERYFDLLAELAEMQVLTVVLSGGEPLSHPDFLAIGARARELGFVVRVKSNGDAFRGALAERIRTEIDPFMVEISLHGATAATHDRQTRVPGSFDRLMANLAEMKALGFRVRINSTLTRWNESELDAMFDLTEKLGLPFYCDPEVTTRDDGSREPLEISPSREALTRLFTRMKERQGDAGGRPEATAGRLADEGTGGSGSDKHCGAGNSTLTSDPYGNIYPGVQWRVPVGNLHTQTIREVWRGSGPLGEIRALSPQIKASVAAVGAPPGFLGFCPGAAWAQTGSPFAVIPTATDRAVAMADAFEPGTRMTLPTFLSGKPRHEPGQDTESGGCT
ncbi:MAG: radical SAM protein [Thermoanaerobaculia bacterium]|nr:radical SAM protein [Thermoanaerobaculia bacterium]